MSYLDQQSHIERVGNAFSNAFIVCLNLLGHKYTRPTLIIGFVLFAIYDFATYPPLKKIENASQFIWPDGCDRNAYRFAEERDSTFGGTYTERTIDCDCFLKTNVIPDYKEFGLRRIHSSKSNSFRGFYRIGDDAIALEEHYEKGRILTCREENRYENFFVTKSAPPNSSTLNGNQSR